MCLTADDKLPVLDEFKPAKSKDISRTSQPSKPSEKKSEKRPDRLKFLNGDAIFDFGLNKVYKNHIKKLNEYRN